MNDAFFVGLLVGLAFGMLLIGLLYEGANILIAEQRDQARKDAAHLRYERDAALERAAVNAEKAEHARARAEWRGSWQ